MAMKKRTTAEGAAASRAARQIRNSNKNVDANGKRVPTAAGQAASRAARQIRNKNSKPTAEGALAARNNRRLQHAIDKTKGMKPIGNINAAGAVRLNSKTASDRKKALSQLNNVGRAGAIAAAKRAAAAAAGRFGATKLPSGGKVRGGAEKITSESGKAVARAMATAALTQAGGTSTGSNQQKPQAQSQSSFGYTPSNVVKKKKPI